MHTNSTRRRFIELRAQGVSYRNIAAQLGISKETAFRWDTEYRAEIDELQRLQLDELLEAYQLSKIERVKALGDLLTRINAALEEADLSIIPPDKLLQFRNVYSDKLVAEAKISSAVNTITRERLAALSAKVDEGNATLADAERAADAARRFADADAALLAAQFDDKLKLGGI